MKFHHDFHHQAYINNLNKAMAGKEAATLASLMPTAKANKLNNAGGGHYNVCAARARARARIARVCTCVQARRQRGSHGSAHAL